MLHILLAEGLASPTQVLEGALEASASRNESLLARAPARRVRLERAALL